MVAEVVSRARFADALGFDGVWGFDHFRPMYGEGVGECFEGMSTLAALSGVTAEMAQKKPQVLQVNVLFGLVMNRVKTILLRILCI